MVDGEEQMECWGEHRVAKGVKRFSVMKCSEKAISASFELPSGAMHSRTIVLEDSLLTVSDSFSKKSCSLVESSVRFNPNCSVEVLPNGEVYVHGPECWIHAATTVSAKVTLADFAYSPQMGVLLKAEGVVWSTSSTNIASRYRIHAKAQLDSEERK